MALVEFKVEEASLAELSRNYKEAKQGEYVVRNAIRYKVDTYSGGLNPEERKQACKDIMRAITAERKRRRELKNKESQVNGKEN